MSTSSLRDCTFRPQLEVLENREQPSQLGVGLFLLNNAINTQITNETNLVARLQTAQTTLTTDINNGATSTTINNDYSTAASLFGQIKNANSQISAFLTLEQTLIFASFGSDSFDQAVAGFIFFFNFNSMQKTNTDNLTTATNTVNMTEPGGFPTIGTGANV
jgi:hypothetical protein